MNRSSLRLAVCGSIAVLVSCQTAMEISNDAGSGGGGGSAIGGGAGGGGGAAQSSFTKAGHIILTTQIGSFELARGVATFSELPADAGCRVLSSEGPCVATDCVLGAAAAQPTLRGAGVLTISGTSIDGGVRLTATSETNGVSYSHSFFGQSMWSAPGQTLTIGAAGDVVPAFTAQTISSPVSLTPSAPSCSAGNCGIISRAQPIVFTWSGGATGTLAELDLNSSDGVHSVSVKCFVASELGTFSIPTSIGGALLPFNGTLLFTSTAEKKFTAGDWPITVHASSYLATYGGFVTLQ